MKERFVVSRQVMLADRWVTVSEYGTPEAATRGLLRARRESLTDVAMDLLYGERDHHTGEK